jgi:S1-C subfamily serine protease
MQPTGLTDIIRWLVTLIIALLSGLAPLVAGEEEREEDRRARRGERIEIEITRSQYEEAQRALREAMMRMAELQALAAERQRVIGRQMVRYPGRAGIGIVVQTEPDPETDRIGAAIVAITPGGAAEQAGLKTGDVITAVNGERLVVEEERTRRRTRRPAARLIEKARRLKPGDEVSLKFVRRGKPHMVTVEARPLPHASARIAPVWLTARDGESLITIPELEDLSRIWSDLSHLEMVELNPDLGEYFGVDEGVLVVQAPRESALKVRSGDVLLRVGEYRLKTPQQAVRVLRDIGPGKSIAIQVLRKGDRIVLTTTGAAGPEAHERHPEDRHN